VIANYGYRDGSGDYFIAIDTQCCVACAGRWCVEACPRSLFVIEPDDYDDEVATIAQDMRRQLKEQCAECKPAAGHAGLPCKAACRPQAIAHSW
jgi:ferredoxin